MRRPRLYVDQPLDPGAALRLPEGPARHLIQVLRLRTGDPLLVFNGNGQDYEARVAETGRSGAMLSIGAPGPLEPEPRLDIALALGISRGERMDFAIQKAVELGVSGIRPLMTERGMVQLSGERLERRLAHWQGVLIGACEQSGRRRLPWLAPAQVFADWAARALPGTLLLDPLAELALVRLPRPTGPVTLLVGPEGGLSPSERALARSRGMLGVRLGPRILRAETAPLAAIAALQSLWGDWGDEAPQSGA
jgi:16S rRNA (uracil1498-N3)-methyltransferase